MAGRSNGTNGALVGWGALLAVLLAAWPPARAADQALVIRGVSVFDTASGTMKPNRTVVVSGERIEAVGTPGRPAAV
jgi:hypothetical protein